MSKTLNELYLKYLNKISQSIENDDYFQYLFKMVMAGDNTISQTNRILHKTVDERWLTTVEDAIPHIDAIITKPRRFIAQDEELVPVDLAKKITADSVRNLSQHTENISGYDRKTDTVIPSKILNVTTRESFDLYENRFINTMILKLINFIDKRTDIIFWSTGDERMSLLEMNSHTDDTYEDIEYKLSITIKNKQSYLENDMAQLDTFKRIDRVRRVVMEFKRSAFCQTMAGTSSVRSPIQRTNLIVKDPHYRKCYELWQFLETYDDVGYSIDARDIACEFDEEYLIQMYTNMIMGYSVFKSILTKDQRLIEEARPQRRRVLKPKFVKKIVEQIVDDYDIPDVEIRKVIIEEITKAQQEIEKRKTEREMKLAAQREQERVAREKERERERARKEKEEAAERVKAEKEKAKEKERAAKIKAEEAAKAKAAREKEKLKAKAEKEKAAAAEKLKAAKEKEKEKKAKAEAAAKEALNAAKAKEKEKAEKQRQKALEKERAAKAAAKAKAKEKAAAKLAKEKAKAKEKMAKEKEKNKAKNSTKTKKKTVKKTETEIKEKVEIENTENTAVISENPNLTDDKKD